MCLLTFLPAGVTPDLGALANGAEANNDGHGFAIVTGRRHDELIVHRGLDAAQVVDAFAAARAAHPAGPALFHSRFATHGDTDLDNCHPFVVGGDTRTVLAHNGVLPPVVQPGKNEHRSDTRIAAEDFIPAFGSLRRRPTRLALQRWMTPVNKMVVLTVDRRFKQRAYILNEDFGIWDSGIWYSNTGYRPCLTPRRYLDHHDTYHDDMYADHIYRGGRHHDDRDQDRWYPLDDGHVAPRQQRRTWRLVADRCGNCEHIIDADDDACPWCGWCVDCRRMPELCFCFTPAALDRTGEGSSRL